MEIFWSSLQDLANKGFRDVPKGSGVYYVRWVRNGEVVPICRIGGVDSHGLLYLGSAKVLKRRIRELWRAINGKTDEHTFGKTVIFCKVSDLIKTDEYEISWEESQTHEIAVGQEWAGIHLYAGKYKEPLPLNLQIRREFFGILGIAKWDKSRWGYEPDDFVKHVTNS